MQIEVQRLKKDQEVRDREITVQRLESGARLQMAEARLAAEAAELKRTAEPRTPCSNLTFSRRFAYPC